LGSKHCIDKYASAFADEIDRRRQYSSLAAGS
jgi:hypothetical protein